VSPTLGDFLTLARQHLGAAASDQGDLPAAAACEITVEVDRLLTVMYQFAADARSAAGVEVLASSRATELMAASTSLLVSRAAGHFRVAAVSAGPGRPGAGHPAAGHPAAGHLRAAARCLVTGRDLIGGHIPLDGEPEYARSPWLAVIRCQPVGAAMMRELGQYCLQLTPLTAHLSLAAGDGFPAAARDAISAGTEWLAFAGSSLAVTGRRQPDVDGGSLLLHGIPLDVTPPRRPPTGGDEPVLSLVAGVVATSDRLTHLARRSAADPAETAAAWRHDALATAIIDHASEQILTALTRRATALKCPPAFLEGLQDATALMRQASQSWQAVTRAWDLLKTGPGQQLRRLGTDLTDLVLWTGRLARASPDWTPARSNSPLRSPAALARTAGDITAVLTAIADATDAATRIARTDELTIADAAEHTAIYSPARLLPEDNDLTRAYRYRPASPTQITELRTAYQHAITASDHAVIAIDNLLLATPPAPVQALTRTINNHPQTTAHTDGAVMLMQAENTATGPAPEPGKLEGLLRAQQIGDPALLLRAALLDHATQALTAEASAKVQRLARAASELQEPIPSGSRNPGNHGVLTAHQDLPATQSNGSSGRTQISRQLATRPATRRRKTGPAPG
jgi:hypothetical protein